MEPLRRVPRRKWHAFGSQKWPGRAPSSAMSCSMDSTIFGLPSDHPSLLSSCLLLRSYIVEIDFENWGITLSEYFNHSFHNHSQEESLLSLPAFCPATRGIDRLSSCNFYILDSTAAASLIPRQACQKYVVGVFDTYSVCPSLEAPVWSKRPYFPIFHISSISLFPQQLSDSFRSRSYSFLVELQSGRAGASAAGLLRCQI